MPADLRNSELCAYLDGECDGGERERIAAVLARSPQHAQRLAAWRRNDAALRVAFAIAKGGEPSPIIDMEPLTIERRNPETTIGGGLREPSVNARAAVLAAVAGAGGAGAIALALFVVFGG